MLRSRDIEDVLASFGYSFRVESCKLPRKELDNGHLEEMKKHLEKVLPQFSLTSETARREFLIAPVLMEVPGSARVFAWVFAWHSSISQRPEGVLRAGVAGAHRSPPRQR